VTGRGMNHQTGRLIQDQQVLVLEHDTEGQLAGNEPPRWSRLGKLHCDTVAPFECAGRTGTGAVDMDGTGSNEASGLRSG
jgi:hypothetical protein